MEPETTRQEIDRLIEEVRVREQRITQIRAECRHKNTEKIAVLDTVLGWGWGKQCRDCGSYYRLGAAISKEVAEYYARL